ncbi:hypothetical protein FW754_03275 [Acinetobacter sp. 1207_04]|uniref:hypothetical protein n=1 Tax=Acinetobacter sp. 1207_04 TaxID=2604449 RepID=UPI00405861A3
MPGFKFDGFIQATLETNSRKLEGQNHRCSYNYHFLSLKQGKKLKWNIEGGSNLNITFDVQEDLSGRSDRVIFTSIKDGDIKLMPEKTDSIYIANLKQNGKEIDKDYPIKITVTAVE